MRFVASAAPAPPGIHHGRGADADRVEPAAVGHQDEGGVPPAAEGEQARRVGQQRLSGTREGNVDQRSGPGASSSGPST